MKKRSDRILCGMLIAAMLAACLPPALAAPAKYSPRDRVVAWAQAEAYHRGDVPGVDYHRLEKPAGAPFTLTVGSLTFKNGIISGGQEPLSRAEINDIVKDILNGSAVKLTPQELANAQFMVAQAEGMADWGMEDVENAVLQVTGLDNVFEGYRQITGCGTMSKAEYAANLLGYVADKTHNADDQLGLLLTSKVNPNRTRPVTQASWDRLSRRQSLASMGVGKAVAASLDLARAAGTAIAKHQNKMEAMEAALERKLLVEAFYTLAEAKIAEALKAKGGSGEKYMMLDGAKATATGVTFWGYGGLTSRWQADMKLIRATERDGPDGVRGIYRGELTLTLTDLIGFHEAFIADSTNEATYEIHKLNNMSAGIISNMSYLISENSPTTLTVTATAQVEVDVTGEFAAVTGAFAQTPEFFLDMNLAGHSITNTGATNTTDVIFSLRSTELNGFTMGLVSGVTVSVIPGFGAVDRFNYYENWPGIIVTRDPGTLLAPLEAAKFVKIKMN